MTKLSIKEDNQEIENRIQLNPIYWTNLKEMMLKAGFSDVKVYGNFKMDRLEKNSFSNLRDFNRPFLFDNFKLNENEMYTPIAPKLLLESEKFKIILFRTKGSDQATVYQLSDLEGKIKKVISLIDNEIQIK